VKTTLVDNSLFIKWNKIENTGAPVDISVFNSDINLGTLEVAQCTHITYQVTVNSDVTPWENIVLNNYYSYNWKTEFKDTNIVYNPITANTYNALLTLVPNPDSGTSIKTGDYITYQAIAKNTGLTTIWTGTITCHKFTDNNQTTCKVGNCWSSYSFTDLDPGVEIAVNYSVQTSNNLSIWEKIEEQCTLSYQTESGNKHTNSNEVYHTIQWWGQTVDGGVFDLSINTAYRLLNTPDGNPRPDGYDSDYITYEYQYTGSQRANVYPTISQNGSYTDSRWSCSSITWPNTPNAITYNINSNSTSPQSNLSLSSNSLEFSLYTTLPSTKPKTILHEWTLYPKHTITWSELNTWYVNGGTKDLPKESTKHRAIENGTSWEVSSRIQGDIMRHKWKYVPYDTSRCSYSCWSDENPRTCRRSYTLYRWEVVESTPLHFEDTSDRSVTVGGTTGWIKTSNGNIHTNNGISLEWTDANKYDLDSSRTNVNSAPRLYTPPGQTNADYVISSSAGSTNLKTKSNWYINNKTVIRGHWDVYTRTQNQRDFYDDLLNKQLYGEVIEKTDTVLTKLDLELNKVYHYTWWDIYFDNGTNDFIVSWKKATIVIEGDLHIKSDMYYDPNQVENRIEDLVNLWAIVRWNIYVYRRVQYTVWAWYVDKTLHTWTWVQTLKHIWLWVADDIVFQRKAPEYYERDVNEPSEWVVFDDKFFFATPPGFANLDDGIWSYSSNINQYTGEEVEY
jgi:hypothetical protein